MSGSTTAPAGKTAAKPVKRTGATSHMRTPLRRKSRRLEIYPQTRTPEAEADIAWLRPFCDFDPTIVRHAWTRMELTSQGHAMRVLKVDPAATGLRFHLVVENSRHNLLITSDDDGRSIRLEDRPLLPGRETDRQRSRHNRLDAWAKTVAEAGADPMDAPAWAYEWDGLLMATMRHHDITAGDLLKRLDRPRFMCGTSWHRSRRPKGVQPKPVAIEEAPDLCVGGEFDAGRIIVTDLLLSPGVAYRRRKHSHLVMTNDLMPRIAMAALPGMRVIDVFEHPYLTDETMMVRSVRHSGTDTILTIDEAASCRVPGGPESFGIL